jgi:hypothetical protein
MVDMLLSRYRLERFIKTFVPPLDLKLMVGRVDILFSAESMFLFLLLYLGLLEFFSIEVSRF